MKIVQLFIVILPIILGSCSIIGGVSSTNSGKSTTPSSGRLTQLQYVDQFKDLAVRNMKTKKVPASITLAQGILESAAGNSYLAKTANNHFGIKCGNDWKGPTARKDDDRKNECFRKYDSALGSFNDHADFLINRSRYANLFKLKITDYKGWAKGLKQAGYATDPKYANKLIEIIERYGLDQYDRG